MQNLEYVNKHCIFGNNSNIIFLPT